jgi:hypothetical protein
MLKPRINSNWTYCKNLFTRSGSSWVEQGDVWVKINGAWRQLVPPSAIILYDTNQYIEDGYVATEYINPSYETLIRHGTPGTLFGATSHPHHGSSSPSVGLASNPTFLTSGGFKTIYHHLAASHTHTFGGHSHPNEGSNLGAIYAWGGIPYKGCSKIYQGALIPSSISQALSFLTLAVLNPYFIAISNSSSSSFRRDSSFLHHNHGSAAAYNSSVFNTDVYSTTLKWENNSTLVTSHDHTLAAHSEPNTEIFNKGVAYKLIMPYFTNTTIFMDQLPSGSYMFFTSDVALSGWENDTSFENRCMRGSGQGTLGGSDIHGHPQHSATPWSNHISTLTNPGRDGQATGTLSYRYIGYHNHTVQHQHIGEGNHLPPGINLIIKRKL